MDQKPILAGRAWIAIGLLVSFGALANPLVNRWVMKKAPPEEVRTDVSQWRVGGEARVRVTLITADSVRLACASAQVFEGAHCGFGGDHAPWPRTEDMPADDNNKDVIQPYRTSPDNRLVFLSDIWTFPDVAMRVHREPWVGVQAKRLQRFDVTCRVKFVGKQDKMELRWDTTGNWQPEKDVWIGRALDCRVNNS